MKKSELIQIMAVIRNSYNNFSSDELKEALWFDLLKDLPDGVGSANVREYVMNNKYPPSIADIRKADPEQITDYKQMHLDTQTYLQQREEWQRKAIECPPHLSRKHLTTGGGDHKNE